MNVIRLFNCNSRGALVDPPALFHPTIIVGPGSMLTPYFVEKNNITHVINCAFPENSPQWFQEQFPNKYTCLKAVDSETVSIIDWYPQFKDTMDSYLRDPFSKRIFVHCQMGINRSGFLALTYVCQNFGFQLKDTILCTLRQRPCLYQNTKFLKDVSEFLNNG
jgi:hypothetical protein